MQESEMLLEELMIRSTMFLIRPCHFDKYPGSGFDANMTTVCSKEIGGAVSSCLMSAGRKALL